VKLLKASWIPSVLCMWVGSWEISAFMCFNHAWLVRASSCFCHHSKWIISRHLRSLSCLTWSPSLAVSESPPLWEDETWTTTPDKGKAVQTWANRARQMRKWSHVGSLCTKISRRLNLMLESHSGKGHGISCSNTHSETDLEHYFC